MRYKAFYIEKNKRKRAVSSLLQPPPPFGRKPCFTRQRSRSLVLWHVFCPLHLVAVMIFPVSGFLYLFIIQQTVEKTRVKCTSCARPCFFLVSVVCSLHTQNLKLTRKMYHNYKQRKEDPTKKYRTNKIKRPPLPKSSKKMNFQKQKEGKPNEQRTSLLDIRFTYLRNGKTRERNYPIGG